VTERTEEGLLPGVNSYVQVQLLLRDELFVAKRTQEIQRPVVTLLTSYQLLLIPENNHFSFLNWPSDGLYYRVYDYLEENKRRSKGTGSL
jgi:hypothetical protein